MRLRSHGVLRGAAVADVSANRRTREKERERETSPPPPPPAADGVEMDNEDVYRCGPDVRSCRDVIYGLICRTVPYGLVFLGSSTKTAAQTEQSRLPTTVRAAHSLKQLGS